MVSQKTVPHDAVEELIADIQDDTPEQALEKISRLGWKVDVRYFDGCEEGVANRQPSFWSGRNTRDGRPIYYRCPQGAGEVVTENHKEHQRGYRVLMNWWDNGGAIHSHVLILLAVDEIEPRA